MRSVILSNKRMNMYERMTDSNYNPNKLIRNQQFHCKSNRPGDLAYDRHSSLIMRILAKFCRNRAYCRIRPELFHSDVHRYRTFFIQLSSLLQTQDSSNRVIVVIIV